MFVERPQVGEQIGFRAGPFASLGGTDLGLAVEERADINEDAQDLVLQDADLISRDGSHCEGQWPLPVGARHILDPRGPVEAPEVR